ncbi:MAG: hypothetical protein HY699_19920 [Deltaproteobacteria bacterium]|nr:hypothetical protein [Deltaproteobacteria bacterium]
MAALVGALSLSGCATTKRAVYLVVDHHVGMARGAFDILNGEAEAREQRVTKLQADLKQSRAALQAEQDQDRLLAQLRQHVALQDALVAEMVPGHGGHAYHCGGHQQGHAESEGETPNEQQERHQH